MSIFTIGILGNIRLNKYFSIFFGSLTILSIASVFLVDELGIFILKLTAGFICCQCWAQTLACISILSINYQTQTNLILCIDAFAWISAETAMFCYQTFLLPKILKLHTGIFSFFTHTNTHTFVHIVCCVMLR